MVRPTTRCPITCLFRSMIPHHNSNRLCSFRRTGTRPRREILRIPPISRTLPSAQLTPALRFIRSRSKEPTKVAQERGAHSPLKYVDSLLLSGSPSKTRASLDYPLALNLVGSEVKFPPLIWVITAHEYSSIRLSEGHVRLIVPRGLQIAV